MNYDWFDGHCLAKKAVEKDYQNEWEAWRYSVRGKMFLYAGENKQGRPILTMKLEPAYSDLLRSQYPDIVPGYYMNKQHWSTVYRDGNVPDWVVQEMINHSYQTILQSLSKKAQKEIAEG